MNRTALLIALLLGCATEGPAPATAVRPDPPAPAPVPAASGSQTPAPPATPEPKPVAPAEPPVLRPLVWGECRDPSISIIDEQVFTVHHVPHPGASYPAFDPVIERIAEDGSLAQDLRYDVPMTEAFAGETHRYPPHHLVQFGGRWPDDLFAIVDYGYRDISGVRIAAREDGRWKPLRLFGPTAEWGALWPWVDGSTLTLLRAPKAGRLRTRMAVVRGPGKGPSVRALAQKPGCSSERIEFSDVHVSTQGPVTALVKCEALWLARWTPEDLEGTLVQLPEAVGGELELDEAGNGYLGLRGAGLFTLDGGTLQPLDAPGDAPRDLAVDANGALWLADLGEVYRRSPTGWQREGISEVGQLAGVEGSTPMVEDRVGDLHARTEDGTWHPVALEQPDEKGTRPEILQIASPSMGDVFVAAKYTRYRKGKRVLRKFGLLYTTRPVGAPRVCK